MADPESLRKPPALHPGDQIALVAPSRPGSPARLAAATLYLQNRGYRVAEQPHVRTPRAYVESDDVVRATEMASAFLDDDINALFCVRGGYGSGRLLDRLDFEVVAAHPKVFVGFSDTTALNLALYARCRLVSFSGAVSDLDLAREEGPEELTESSLWRAVSTTTPLGELPLDPPDLDVIAAGRARGRLVPATLTLLCSLLGTPYLPDLEGAILLLEDVDEEPYRLDRMLNQLRLSGVLEGLSGLILGQFRSCFREGTSWPRTLAEMVSDLAGASNIPILSGIPYGHFSRRLVVPVGVMAELDTESSDPALRILEEATTAVV